MRSKTYFLVLLSIIYLPLLSLTSVSIMLKILFTLNFSVLFIITIYYLYKDKRFSPILASYIVFNFLFFILAPMLQIHEVFSSGELALPNRLIYKDHLMIKTNLYIFIFNIVFFT